MFLGEEHIGRESLLRGIRILLLGRLLLLRWPERVCHWTEINVGKRSEEAGADDENKQKNRKDASLRARRVVEEKRY